MSNNLLLVSPKFFGYENHIKKAFEDKGFHVHMIIISHLGSTLDRLLKNVSIYPVWKENRIFNRELKKIYVQFEYIIVIRGDLLSFDTISRLKKNNPVAKTILYLWDSIEENKHVIPILSCFDKVKSFDSEDCKRYNFELLPLFYIDEYEMKHDHKVEYRYAFSFVGRDHSDRYRILTSLNRQVSAWGYNTWIHLTTTKLGFIKRKIKNTGIHKTDFKFYNLTPEEIKQKYDESECVVDIELEKQSGLTIRTFEALAAGKKLITTNQRIKDYDFYNTNNILVIDREKPIITKDFLERPFEYLDSFNTYSINNWTSNILR